MTTKIYAFFVIGNGSPDDSKRRVGEETLWSGGWAKFKQQKMDKAAALGFDAIWIHNPFGCRSDEKEMALDQYFKAKKAGLGPLTDNFVAPIKQFIAETKKPVVAYFGNPAHYESELFQKVLKTKDPVLCSNLWKAAARQCVLPALQAGCQLGFDAAHSLAPTSLYREFVEDMKKETKVFIEPTPSLSQPGEWSDNYCVTSETLQRMDFENGRLTSDWVAPADKRTGECVALANSYYLDPITPAGAGWPPARETWDTVWSNNIGTMPWGKSWTLDQIRKGRSVGLGPSWFLQHNINIKQYLGV